MSSDQQLQFDEDGYLDLASFDDGDTLQPVADGALVDAALAGDQRELDDSYDDAWLAGPLETAVDPDAGFAGGLDPSDDWLPAADDADGASGGPFDVSDYDVADPADGEDTADDAGEGEGDASYDDPDRAIDAEAGGSLWGGDDVADQAGTDEGDDSEDGLDDQFGLADDGWAEAGTYDPLVDDGGVFDPQDEPVPDEPVDDLGDLEF